jgi:hypothetical protein
VNHYVKNVLLFAVPMMLSCIKDLNLCRRRNLFLRLMKETIIYKNLYGESFEFIHERLFSLVADCLSVEKVEQVCENYKNLRFHKGAVELVLLFAQKVDPAGYALGYYNSGQYSTVVRLHVH